MITLRPYQKEIIKQLRQQIKEGNKRIVLCLPTGGGKTIVFTFMVSQHLQKPNTKALIITDRIELMYQAGGAVERYDLEPTLIKAGVKNLDTNNNSFVGMVETISRRRKKLEPLLNEITLVIADEAHKGNFKKLYDLFPNAFIIGATATPVSSKANNLSKLFDSMVVGVQVPQLIEQGYLSKPIHYAPEMLNTNNFNTVAGEYNQSQVFDAFNTTQLYEGLLNCFDKYGRGKSLIFCVNINHTINTYEVFKSAGYNVEYLVSTDSKEKRTSVLNWFSKTPDSILVNCGILTTGYDEPTIETVVLNRATKSLPLYMQMIGRGSRVTETKKEFTIIDMGDNVSRLGLWEAKRDWFKFWEYKKKSEGVEPVKNCPKCEAMIRAAAKDCPYCGHAFPIKIKEIPVIENMYHVNSYRELPANLQKQWQDMSVKELIERAKYGSFKTGRPYKSGWIVRQLKERGRQALEEYAIIKGYKKNWVNFQLQM